MVLSCSVALATDSIGKLSSVRLIDSVAGVYKVEMCLISFPLVFNFNPQAKRYFLYVDPLNLNILPF